MAEYNLTNEEKNNIIITHLRTLEFQKYNIEISILEEQALDNPNEESIASYNTQISSINLKIARLEAESTSLASE